MINGILGRACCLSLWAKSQRWPTCGGCLVPETFRNRDCVTFNKSDTVTSEVDDALLIMVGPAAWLLTGLLTR